MENSSFIELRKRLALALDLRECGSAIARDGKTVIKYYLDRDNNPMGLVNDWHPDAPEKIIQVIESYGLHVERQVKTGTKPMSSDEIVWEYHVWSRNPIYRSLSQDGYARKGGPRIVASDLTTAVLTWAVLRAERVKQLRESKLEASMYNFHTLREKVYVSSVG